MLADHLASPIETPTRRKGSRAGQPLSSRENEILIAMTQGLKSGSIAVRIGLSRKTVSTFRERILEKTGASNDVQLGIWALRNGLVGLS